MVDFDNVFFNVAAFIGGLFVLEYGADTFIDHTAKVASRLGISPTLIALITAGAEWEEVCLYSQTSNGSADTVVARCRRGRHQPAPILPRIR